MVGEALGAERAVDAVEAVHVALALVRVRVHLALPEEAGRQQRLEPRRPALVLGLVALASAHVAASGGVDPEQQRRLVVECHFGAEPNTASCRLQSKEEEREEGLLGRRREEKGRGGALEERSGGGGKPRRSL